MREPAAHERQLRQHALGEVERQPVDDDEGDFRLDDRVERHSRARARIASTISLFASA